MYYGGTNQETKEQRSRKKGKEEQEKWEKTTLHSKRVCKKKDLGPLFLYLYVCVCVYRFGEKVMQRVQPKLKLVDFIWYELV